MSRDSKARDEAESRFARAQKMADEASKAMREYQAESARIDANTARLRALRLEREAAERENPPAKPVRTRKKKA